MNTVASFQSAPEFSVLIAKERQADLLREANERRLARASRAARKDGRTRGRFLRWH